MKRFSELRILMTTDAVGGVWTYATALACAFAARGAQVYLLTQGRAPSEAQRAMISEPSVRLLESRLALEWQDPEGRNVTTARRVLGDLEARLKPDIVHLNSFREAAFDWHCPVVVGAHSCVNSWALACDDAAWLSDARWRHYTRDVEIGLARANAWVCPSRAFHDAIVDLYQPRSPGFVIWNGIAPRAAASGQKEAFILAAGRMWDAAKNLPLLMRAADGLDWPVMVAGPTGDCARAGSARLLGELPHVELDRLMQRAAIFASPAVYEPFGLCVLEAASAGCALVLADIPTFRELWRGAALFVDPTDVAAWRQVLAGLCADASRLAQLREAALTRSRAYSLQRMVDSYVALDQSLSAQAPDLSSAPAIEACV